MAAARHRPAAAMRHVIAYRARCYTSLWCDSGKVRGIFPVAA